jgi:hypothetical protein
LNRSAVGVKGGRGKIKEKRRKGEEEWKVEAGSFSRPRLRKCRSREG